MRDPLQKGGYNNRSFHAGAGANGSVGSIGRVVGEARKRNRTTAGTIIKESSASLVKTKFIERCGFCGLISTWFVYLSQSSSKE